MENGLLAKNTPVLDIKYMATVRINRKPVETDLVKNKVDFKRSFSHMN